MKLKILLSTLFASFLLSSNLSAQQLTLEWAKQMGGTGGNTGNSIAIDASGNLYTTGTFSGTVDFDPSGATFNLTSNGQTDIFITKLDAQGNVLWAKQIGGDNYDEGVTVSVDVNGNILVGGSINGTLDLNPGSGTLNITTTGTEAFLLKLDTKGEFLWAKHWGGNNSSSLNSIFTIATDNSENIITGGSFQGTNDFDPGAETFIAEASGFADAYISKLDSNGNFVWAVTFGGNAINNSDQVTALDVDGSGNIVASGPFHGTDATFNLQDGGNFYMKLDASGNLMWSKQTLGTETNTNSLKLDGAENAYMVGRFAGTRDFDPGLEVFNLTSSSGYFDIFILKLDASGNFVWAKSFGGSANLGADSGNELILDDSGNVYTIGTYVGAGDFDPGPGTFMLAPVGFVDMFFLKLDANGNFIHAATFGSMETSFSSMVEGNSLAIAADNKVYFTGSFNEVIDFDPGVGTTVLTSKGSRDIFILKLSSLPVGLIENSFSDQLTVYPNPTDGKFTVKSDNILESLNVRLHSLTGQLILNKNFQYINNIQLEINQPSGIYILETIDEQGNKTALKIVKQ